MNSFKHLTTSSVEKIRHAQPKHWCLSSFPVVLLFLVSRNRTSQGHFLSCCLNAPFLVLKCRIFARTHASQWVTMCSNVSASCLKVPFFLFTPLPASEATSTSSSSLPPPSSLSSCHPPLPRRAPLPAPVGVLSGDEVNPSDGSTA